jgi:hypothetical protein
MKEFSISPRWNRPLVFLSTAAMIFSAGYGIWFHHTYPQPSPARFTSAPLLTEPEITLRPDQRELVLQFEAWKWIRIDAEQGVVWVKPDVWGAVNGPNKEDFAAVMSLEIASRLKLRTADVEIRDMQTAKTLATWKYSLMGTPKFKAP